MKINILRENPLIFTIDNFLSENLCDFLIKYTESSKDYEIAPITLDSSKGIHEVNTDIRNNSRVIIDNELAAFLLFKQLKEYLPQSYKEIWKLSGLNSRLRFYKYEKGQTFKEHLDGKYKESNICESKYTLLIYLSENFEGGNTIFRAINSELSSLSVKPSKGQVLVFDHHQFHSGDPVLKGVKYVLRTDIMYTRST